MITNEQASRLYRLVQRVKGRIICLDYSNEWQQQKKELFAEIAANKPTNGDRWRAMSDEQIAEIITADGCRNCPVEGIDHKCAYSDMSCISAVAKWLKEEVSQ